MHHISYQNPENESRSVPTGADDATPLNVRDEMLFSPRVEASSPTTKRGMKIPMVVALVFWVAIMTLELSPFLLILRSNEAAGSATSFPNDNGGDGGDDDDDDDDNAFGALWGSSASFAEIVFGIRPCSIEECISSPCQDSKSTRFACLTLQHNTNVRGGCGATPWTHEVCADQCDASVCAYRLSKLEDSSLTESSNGSSNSNSNIPVDHCDVECPKQWCERKRLCGSEIAPYQCTVGDSIYGCSADKFEWTVRSNEVDCSSCCNTSSCS
mmetsp:Transcript_22768/g.63292  ORF Transcript_22768/g.63292 Transcript_22768/m.63292 type:complete len:270 (-) Transcript_22768:971-1780(-)